ncbi:MAG TPA: four helix bundle protein [Thermoanaerobaculia bacterium]|nr:four helix bundle protein [Thermoanaerobaculia bacterium]
MSRIERFEDLVAWQKARRYACVIHELTRQPTFARDFKLRDQIWDAAISISSNIAEGFERNGMREFHQYLSISKASCGEVRSQLYLAYDVGHIDERTLRLTLAQGVEVGRIIGGLRRSVELEIAKTARKRKLRTQDSGLRTES